VYETIDDKDNYMHFFIDPAVIFPSFVDKSNSLQLIDKLNLMGCLQNDMTKYRMSGFRVVVILG
jgi:hypothetical protein